MRLNNYDAFSNFTSVSVALVMNEIGSKSNFINIQ